MTCRICTIEYRIVTSVVRVAGRAGAWCWCCCNVGPYIGTKTITVIVKGKMLVRAYNKPIMYRMLDRACMCSG